MSTTQITYHKKTFFPSSPYSAQFKLYDSSKIFFSSGNKLVLYDIAENKKVFRINLRGKKIISLQQNQNDLNEIYVLDIENIFYKFNTLDKSIQCQYQLDKARRYQTFYIDEINNQIFFISNDTDLLLTILEITYDKETIVLNKKSEYSLNPNKTNNNSNNQPTNINNSFIIQNNYIVTYLNNNLIIHNITSKTTETIPFIKKISTITFLPNKPLSVAVGDITGKIHFISDITEKNYIISTKHWHSHKVHCLFADSEGMYLYSAGQEGVIVIWNLNTEARTFLPRLNGVISLIKPSDDGKYILAYLQDHSLKIIDLALMKIVNEISSISQNNVNVNSCVLFKNKLKFITFANKDNGLIHFYQVNQNAFPFYLNIMNKNNTISKTENEIQNYKKLTHIAFSSPSLSNNQNDDCSYMITSEQLYNETSVLTTYLKFWKITLNDIDLISLAEDAHMNQQITNLIGCENSLSFISCSDYNFKLWKIQDDSTFKCEYQGQYKHSPLITAVFGNDSVIYALFDRYLVLYEDKIIKRIHSFPSNMKLSKDSKLQIINKDEHLLYIYDNKHLFIFNADTLDICWEEVLSSTKEETILNVALTRENEINVFIKKNENCVYSIKYACDSIKRILQDCMIIQKKKIEFIDIYKRYLIVINSKKDIFLAEREVSQDRISRMTKQEMDDNDLDFK
jgi:WD40 repeat protein